MAQWGIMKVIQDKELLKKLYKDQKLQDIFSTVPRNMKIIEYEKDELIAQPLKQLTSFIFLVDGSVKIYGIDNDARIINVQSSTENTFLGEMEYDGFVSYPFYVQANDVVLTIDIPFRDNRRSFENDLKFYKYRIHQLATNLSNSAKINIIAKSLQERLIQYFKDNNNYIDSVNETMINLHCSRRQLQRVLAKLLETNQVVKIGKGRYQYISK